GGRLRPHRPRRGPVPEALPPAGGAVPRPRRGVRDPVGVAAVPPEDDEGHPAQPARRVQDRAAVHGEHPDLSEPALELHVLLEHRRPRGSLQGSPGAGRGVPDQVLQRGHPPCRLRPALVHGGRRGGPGPLSVAAGDARGQYSAPRYYEIAFDMNRKQEVDFIVHCFRRYARRPVRTVLDIACGTGPHLMRLAARGYRMSGLDLSPENVEFLRGRAAAKGLEVWLTVADMTRFRLPRPVDAALCMQDSQGHLLTNEAIVGHLR